MDQLKNWVKIAVSMLILISLLRNLLPEKRYEKFLNAYLGIMFILLILSPLNNSIDISILFKNDLLSVYENPSDDLINKANNISANISEKELKSLLENQVMTAAIETGISVDEVEITLDRDCTEDNISVKEILLVCSEFGDENSITCFKDKISNMFGVGNVSILIGEEQNGH